nr:hypothetical protein [uncultured Albidiferax sp.]
MSGAAKAPLAAEKPLFNAEGMHWQCYGKEVEGMDKDTRTAVRTYHKKNQIDRKPSVLLTSSAGSFNLNLHLSKTDATSLAMALLDAAHRIHDVEMAIEAEAYPSRVDLDHAVFKGETAIEAVAHQVSP